MKVSEYAREKIGDKYIVSRVTDQIAVDPRAILDLHVGRHDETIAELIDDGAVLKEFEAEYDIYAVSEEEVSSSL